MATIPEVGRQQLISWMNYTEAYRRAEWEAPVVDSIVESGDRNDQ